MFLPKFTQQHQGLCFCYCISFLITDMPAAGVSFSQTQHRRCENITAWMFHLVRRGSSSNVCLSRWMTWESSRSLPQQKLIKLTDVRVRRRCRASSLYDFGNSGCGRCCSAMSGSPGGVFKRGEKGWNWKGESRYDLQTPPKLNRWHRMCHKCFQCPRRRKLLSWRKNFPRTSPIGL